MFATAGGIRAINNYGVRMALWIDAEPMPPWVWRKTSKTNKDNFSINTIEVSPLSF